MWTRLNGITWMLCPQWNASKTVTFPSQPGIKTQPCQMDSSLVFPLEKHIQTLLCKATLRDQASCFLNNWQVFFCSHVNKIHGQGVCAFCSKTKKKVDTFSNAVSLSRNHDSVTQDNPENLLKPVSCENYFSFCLCNRVHSSDLGKETRGCYWMYHIIKMVVK